MLRRRITIAGLVLIALIVAADSYETWLDYRVALTANEHVQLALSRAIAEQTTRLLQEGDVLLADFADWWTTPASRGASEGMLRARLLTDIGRLPFIRSAAVAGRDGHLLASTLSAAVGDGSLKSRSAFTVPAQAAGGALYISRPFNGVRDGVRTFALSRRLQAADGTFDGVVVMRVAYDYLAAFYGSVDISADTTIKLVRNDGTSLVEFPHEGVGDAVNNAVRDGFAAPAPVRELVKLIRVDGKDSLSVLQQLQGYPVAVAVTRPMSGVLQSWKQQAVASAARTIALALLAAALLAGLRAALTRHDRLVEEQRRLEQNLAASQRADALGLLAASMAHDFNNVLSAIVGYGELAGRLVAGQAAEPHITRLLAAADRARLLVQRVLTFDPQRSVAYRCLMVAPVLREALQQVQASLPPTITLQNSGLDNQETVLGDDTEVHQVAMNLLTNAMKAAPKGSTVTASLKTVVIEQPRELAIGKLTAGRWLRLSVADTGAGMSAQQVRSAFEPFYTTARSGQGMGIGLTVVRNIVTRMAGAIEVESTPGRGTTLSIYWPVVAAAAAPPAAALGFGGGESVMVVDDERELVTLAEDLLASLGYEPVGFSDASAALVALRADPGRFGVILTDERMTPMRGLEFAAQAHELVPSLPIILMTGHRSAEIDMRLADAGIVQVLDKPLKLQTMQSAIAAALKR